MSESDVMIITGASSGIGAATARLFGDQGYRVVLAARRIELLQAVADQIQARGGHALPVATDVTDAEAVQNLVSRTLDAYGQIDILLNNAGFGRLKWLEELDPHQDIERQISVNLLGVILTTREVLPHMIARRSGHVINMGSVAGFVASPTYTVYAASKFGVRGFTEALRREVGVWGIEVSAIYPGSVKSEFREKAGIRRKTGVTTPRSMVLSADGVARAVFHAVQNPRRAIIIPWPWRTVAWINVLFSGVLDWVIEKSFVQPERGTG